MKNNEIESGKDVRNGVTAREAWLIHVRLQTTARLDEHRHIVE